MAARWAAGPVWRLTGNACPPLLSLACTGAGVTAMFLVFLLVYFISEVMYPAGA
jgi:hypothetical protein